MVKKKSTTNDKVIKICNRNMEKSKDNITYLKKMKDMVEESEKEPGPKNDATYRLLKKYIDKAIEGYEFASVSLVEILIEVDPKLRKKHPELEKLFKEDWKLGVPPKSYREIAFGTILYFFKI